MRSRETAVGRCLHAFVSAGLIGVSCLLPGVCNAQRDAEVRNLIFEPAVLSAETDSLVAPEYFENRRQAHLHAVREHLAAIDELKSGSNRRTRASSLQLAEQFRLLGAAYQALERHDEAIDALDNAISITRDNGGRDNLEQIPLLELEVSSYLALDDIRNFDATLDRIYSLIDRNFRPTDPEMYLATINLADWNTVAYFRENFRGGGRSLQRQRAVINKVGRAIGGIRSGNAGSSTESPDEFSAGSAGSISRIFSGDVRDVSDQDINDARLRRIDRLYRDYQNVIYDRGNPDPGVIIDIAKRIARLAYHTRQEMDFERDAATYNPNYEGSREQAARNSPLRLDESYDSGKQALEYVLTVLRSIDGVRPEALAASILNLGDWHLAYGKVAAAKRTYREANDSLLAAGFSAQAIEQALSTELPLRIPVFAIHPYTRGSRGTNVDADFTPRGYVDVRYTVDELGNAHSVEILSESSEEDSIVQRSLALQLRSIKFRPVIRNGDLYAYGQVDTRYYYSY